VELRRFLEVHHPNYAGASFKNERILNQSLLAYNGVSMQRSDKNEKNEINQTLPAAVSHATTQTQPMSIFLLGFNQGIRSGASIDF